MARRITPDRLLAALLIAAAASAAGATERSRQQRDEFKRQQPCPANGQARGPCPGFVVDHIEPLCAGGADRPSNMQWQTTTDAKAKDRGEFKLCRSR